MSSQRCPKVFFAIGGLTVRCPGGQLRYIDGRLTENGVALRTWECLRCGSLFLSEEKLVGPAQPPSSPYVPALDRVS